MKLERTISPASLRSHSLFCAPDSKLSEPGDAQRVRASLGLGCRYRLRDSQSVTVGDGGCQCCLGVGARAHLQGQWKCTDFQLCRVEKSIMSSYYKVSHILFIYLVGRACIPGIFGWFVLLLFFFFLSL